MILKKNTVNTCFFTLSERTTLDPVYYLFELINTADNTIKTFLAEDISTNKIRGNEFEIEETQSENRLIGKITLDLIGDYTYNIYEQSSSTNLDTSLTGSLVETGRVDLIEDVTEDSSFEQTNTIKVFNQ